MILYYIYICVNHAINVPVVLSLSFLCMYYLICVHVSFLDLSTDEFAKHSFGR
jgi:hypothetical protein